MKVLLQVLAVLWAVLLTTTSAAPNYGGLAEVLEEDGQRYCKRNQSCRWAVCQWSQWFLVTEDNCQFVESQCACPPELECTRTNAVRPGSEWIVFKYRCQ